MLIQRFTKVGLWDFQLTVKGRLVRLRALYAKSFRITLAPPVLPRLLAQSWPGLFLKVLSQSYLKSEFYDQSAFFTHAMWLGQASAHCPRFPTAATRRCPGRVSVPVWLIILSDQLGVIGLV